MISFWISVLPPKIDWTRLSRRSSQSWQRAVELLLPSVRRAPSGQREPRRSCGVIWVAITRHGIVSPRRNSPSRSVAPTTTPPNQRQRMSQPSMRTSTYAFVTFNYGDFSVPNGDRRQPHPDLAGLFGGI
jgi:hypothetical protein